jgi:hypothetical protein
MYGPLREGKGKAAGERAQTISPSQDKTLQNHTLTKNNPKFPNKIPCQVQKPANSIPINNIRIARELSPISYN